ncbi:MAG: hypothetical protein R2754_04560 [Microthrixaceae bacterium]
MRTLGEAFRSTFQEHEAWPRHALAGLGDQVSLDTPVRNIEPGAIWLLEEGEDTALPTLLILTEDRLVFGQVATGRGGLRWLTLSSVENLDAVEDQQTGARLRLELFVAGELGVGVKCSDPFVESLVESLRRTAGGPRALPSAEAESRRNHPSQAPSRGAESWTGRPANLSDALAEVDDDPSRLEAMTVPPLREGPVSVPDTAGVPPATEPESSEILDGERVDEAASTSDAASTDDAADTAGPESGPDQPVRPGEAIAMGPATTETDPGGPLPEAEAPQADTPPPEALFPDALPSDAPQPEAPEPQAGAPEGEAVPWVPPADWAPPTASAPGVQSQPPTGTATANGALTPPPPPPGVALDPSLPPGAARVAPQSDGDDAHLPTRNRGKAYDVGLEAERNLTANATQVIPAVPAAPHRGLTEPPPPPSQSNDPVTPSAPPHPTDAPAGPGPTSEMFPAASDTAAAASQPSAAGPAPVEHPPSADIAPEPPQFEVPPPPVVEDADDEVWALPGADLSGDAPAPPDFGAATLQVPVVDAQVPSAPAGESSPESDPAAASQAPAGEGGEPWTSWPTDAPNLATPAGYGDEEYDPAVDDFSDLAAGATSFDGPDEAQPTPEPAMVGVSKANDGWWRTMPMWPEPFRSMSYLGGHPAQPKKRKNITMFFRPEGIRAEAGGFGSWKIEVPWEQVIGLNVESSDELMFHANIRIDLSSAALAVQTEAGTLYFECRLRRPASVRSTLAPLMNAMGGTTLS